MFKLLIPMAIAALFVYQLAEAQEPGTGVNARQHTQMDRIREGAGSGEWRRDAQPRPNAGGMQDGLSINEREARQREAIRRGNASGELTRHEADRLRSEQMRIERMEQRARADGNFTPQERARINRQLDNSARHIQHETHDRQRATQHDSGWHGQHNGRHYGHSQHLPNHDQHAGNFQRSAYQGHSFDHSQPAAQSAPQSGRR